MTFSDILQRCRKQPFRPFRVHVSDGSSYEVFHRDAILVTFTAATVGLFESEGGEVPDRTVEIDVAHITRLETIDEPATA